MNSARIRAFFLVGVCSIMAASLQTHLWAQANQGVNLTKEIEANKDKMNWKTAADGSLIPTQVCDMLQVCAGTEKYAALPRASENGQLVGRIVYQTQDEKHADVLILSHQTVTERYYFLLSPDGTLSKTAYGQLGAGGGASWVEMGHTSAQPVFDKDKNTWHTEIGKLGAGAEKKT